MHFDDLASGLVILDEWVEWFGLLASFGKKVLDDVVVKQILLSQSKNLEGLLLGHKAALNAQSLLSDLFAASGVL